MSDFTFIDLFAGIGGMRIAFEDLGGKCVFASEIEPHASKVYEDNFGVTPQHDIIELDPSDRKQLPRFDILLGGGVPVSGLFIGRQAAGLQRRPRKDVQLYR